jgi:hypothetical protein
MATDGREQLERLRREAEEQRQIALAIHARALELARKARMRREARSRQDTPDRFRRPDEGANDSPRE